MMNLPCLFIVNVSVYFIKMGLVSFVLKFDLVTVTFSIIKGVEKYI